MTRETQIKRLYFRSAHRGSKETDMILGPYALKNLDKMSGDELNEFEAFLSENDTDIWNWVVEKSSPAEQRYDTLLKNLRALYTLKN